jgi:hypothetical protein
MAEDGLKHLPRGDGSEESSDRTVLLRPPRGTDDPLVVLHVKGLQDAGARAPTHARIVRRPVFSGRSFGLDPVQRWVEHWSLGVTRGRPVFRGLWAGTKGTPWRGGGSGAALAGVWHVGDDAPAVRPHFS